ncbi:MAG: hypothetical protein KGL37_10005 [Acidobacteriota bacterium]|nr:hypothetical protein [Acidobacteriota bacterium]
MRTPWPGIAPTFHPAKEAHGNIFRKPIAPADSAIPRSSIQRQSVSPSGRDI